MDSETKKLIQEVDSFFNSTLSDPKEYIIRIQDVTTGEILDNINYQRILFDDNLNIYKITNGQLELVDNPKFKAVLKKI